MHDYTAGKAWKIERRQKIIEAGFRMFSQRGIESVTMYEVAKESGIGPATLNRYFHTKLDLVMAIGVWTWEEYIDAHNHYISEKEMEEMTGARYLRFYLDAFIDLYRNHKDLLRFNYNLNSFLSYEAEAETERQPMLDMVGRLKEQFHGIYERGMKDGTLNTEISEESMFSSSFHIMLAAVTRYAVGLVYIPEGGTDPEGELIMLEELLLSKFAEGDAASPR